MKTWENLPAHIVETIVYYAAQADYEEVHIDDSLANVWFMSLYNYRIGVIRVSGQKSKKFHGDRKSSH